MKWARKLKASGPCDTLGDRYQIQDDPDRKRGYVVVDLVTGRRIDGRSRFSTMRDAAEFIDLYCGSVPA